MREIIKGFDNVLYDESSGYAFEQLNETVFIEKLFQNLSNIMGKTFKDYIFFVLSSHDPDVIPSSLTYQSKQKKILVFISEEKGIVPRSLSNEYFAIFKAYMSGDTILQKNIFNFSLGCVKEVPQLPVKAINDRTYSVFFIGNLNNSRMSFYLSLINEHIPLRVLHLKRFLKLKELFLKIKSKFDSKFPHAYIRFTNGFKHGITPIEYGSIIADSKIVLCPKGFNSTECFRHYEAMRAGCVLVSERLPDTHFYHNSPIIQIESWNEGLKIVDQLLQNSIELEKISHSTQRWWNEKCSEKATAQFMNQCITEL